jgi:hypothetical protein
MTTLTSGEVSAAALRSQTLDLPVAIRATAVAQTVVATVLAMLPELECLGRQAKAAPAVGEREVIVGVVGCKLGDALLEPFPARDHLTLG